MKIKPFAVGAGAFIYSALALSVAMADDTEIYVPKDLPADQQVRPNILFILDSSGSMDTQVPNTGGKSRNRVMREVVNNLIDQLKTKEDVNIGLMRFRGLNNNSEQGGHIISPVQRLTQANAASIKTIVNGIPAEDWTPLSETYYEAYRYMTGQTPVWGNTMSVASSKTGTNYKSPIEHSCQKSHIIYVTDGAPTRDVGSNAAIRSLVNGKNTLYPSSSCLNSDGQCLPHLAEFMANQDLFPAPTPFSDPTNRKQTVTSHFVGFAVDLPLLKNAAAAGGGKYYTSDNVSGLTDALKSIIVDITAENTTFAAPSVSVSAFNNLGFRSDLYYALFRPAEGTRWPGNVKRYKLTKDEDGNPLIVDKNGVPAIDSTTGFFSESSSSFWSNLDGKDVAKGGVAGRLINPDLRKVYTWTDTDRTPTASAGVSGSSPLNVSRNIVSNSTSSSQLTNAMLGATSTTERTTFIDWARGKNTDGTARLSVGDVLHNEPKLAAYKTDEDLTRAGTATSPEQLYMFFGSNEGFLHAVDPTTGNEKFAFIPKELLSNPGFYYKNASGSSNKRYGMDGQINLWTEYGPLDSATKTRNISKAWLYAGMRRGGSNYYALDVTDIDAPALKWILKGPEQTLSGSSYTNATTGFTSGFAKLGRTFSAPKLAKIKLNNIETKVLIFTGGYDLDQDIVGTNTPKSDDIGNALFIVDADTGALIWRAGNTGDTAATLQVANMTNSMPADPTIVDISGDGLADIIYASDLRGQVFRFDINNANTGATGLAKGGRIASLAGNDAANNRRFFTAPDVALTRERGGSTYFTISLGSGHRESPLNTDTNDRFYVIRDTNVNTVPVNYTTITESDLLDVSSIDANAATTAQLLADIAALEAQMAALNQAVSTAQSNFTAYKVSSGHTAQQNAAIQAYGDANAKQAQMDLILASAPYVVEHAPNSRQQSLLQDALKQAQAALKGIKDANDAAQAQTALYDVPSLTVAADSAIAAESAANTAFNNAKAISDADASQAASTEATAQASEAAATTAAAAFATAQGNKTAADAALTAAQASAAAAASADSLATTQLTNAQNDLAAKVIIQTTATNEHSTADAAASAALAAKNTADSNVTNATTAVATATSERNSAQSDLAAAQAALDADIANNGGTGDPGLIAARDNAQNNLDDKQAALTTANNNLSTAQTAAAAADTAWQAADADATSKLNAKNSADAAVTVATTTRDAAQTTKNTTAAALTTANNDVTAKTADQTAADTALAAATIARDNTAATATTDRANANTAAATAAASLAVTTQRQADWDAAITAKNDAIALRDQSIIYRDAALAMAAQLERMRTEYQKLAEFQSQIDASWANIEQMENDLIAAKADPDFDSDQLPSMEAALLAARQAYALNASVVERTRLNTGNPTTAIASLNAVSAALAAGDSTAVAAALATALGNLETTLAMTASGNPALSISTLLQRDEAAASAALLSKANNEQTVANQLATLASERDALKAQGDGYQLSADTIADQQYNTSTQLLTSSQLSAAIAQYGSDLTTFEAYTFLIDQAIANASNPANGVPYLRTQINNKYALLTPGNSYTPNPTALAAAQGFYLRLPKGEKVLSNSLSFRGAVLFSTFSPRGQAVSTCGSDVGRGRTYAISLSDASAVYTVTSNGVTTPTRSFDNVRSGIPPSPSVIVVPGGRPAVITGTEIRTESCAEGVKLCTSGDAVRATYWRENR